ncbi:MAG TPA: hypothetical protein VH349_15560 [Ktedonobacterales bacterium]
MPITTRAIVVGIVLGASLVLLLVAPAFGAPTVSNPIATPPANVATPTIPAPTTPPTGTAIPTAAPTEAPTLVPTATQAPTPLPSATVTPTTVAPTATASATTPPTASPTRTASATVAPTAIPTAIPTATLVPKPTPTTTPTPTPPPSASAKASLGHTPMGSMSITYDPATRVAHTVLNMAGLSPGGAAVAVVLNGSCAAPGGVAWRGAPFTADANGRLSGFVVNYANVNGVPTNHVVAIETVQGGNETRANYLLACGPIASTKTAGTNSGSVTLGPVPGAANGAVSGSATLTLANDSLTITVKASGLAPSSTHASALHLGSCQWLDAVLYDLPKLTADSSGNASASITIDHAQPVSASNNWYIAIDYNSTLNRAYFMPISCGNVVMVAPS